MFFLICPPEIALPRCDFYGRCPEGIGRHKVKMSVLLSFYMSVMSHFLGLWLVKNIIVIEVEVDELHEGKILSRPSTSMEIKEIKRGWTELCHTRNQTKNKKMSPPKFTYSGRICRFAQFLFTNSVLQSDNCFYSIIEFLNEAGI